MGGDVIVPPPGMLNATGVPSAKRSRALATIASISDSSLTFRYEHNRAGVRGFCFNEELRKSAAAA